MAQGAQPSDDAVAGADAGPAAEHFGPAQAAVAQGSGEGGYTVPYELPPAVEGVFPTYASLEQARSGAVPTDPRSRSTSTDEYSPAASRSPAPPAPTGQENRGAQMAHRADPFATTSTGGRRKDLRLLSFTQALPYLSRLAEDPTFIALLRQVRHALSLFRPSTKACGRRLSLTAPRSVRRILTRAAALLPAPPPLAAAQLKADQDAFERRLSDERKQLIERHKAETEKARFKCVPVRVLAPRAHTSRSADTPPSPLLAGPASPARATWASSSRGCASASPWLLKA